jgi:IS1 transposase
MVFVIRCRQCRKTFCDRYGTAFYDLKTEEAKVQRSIHQTLEGLCPEAVARIEGIHPTTVQRWVGRAATQAQAADQEIIDQVSAGHVEVDELYSFAGVKHPDPEVDSEQVGQHWTHCAMARESRLLLEVVVGPRTEETAIELVSGAAARLAPNCWPLWSSDGWKPYEAALLKLFCVVIHFIRSRRRGRPNAPRRVPDPRLRYGQVVKAREGRRLVAVTRRVVFGVAELIPLGEHLDLVARTTERDDPAARRALASQDTQFRQVPRGPQYARATLQELLQPVSPAQHLARSNASTSSGCN